MVVNKIIYFWWLLLLFGESTALHCYQCGVGFSQDAAWLSRGVGTDEIMHASPDSFCFDYDEDNKKLHSYYESVTCEPGHLCVKVVTRNAGQNTFSVQRGCVLETMASGEPHTVTCGPLVSNERSRNVSAIEHICFCDSNFCNGQSRYLPSVSTYPCVLFSLIILFYNRDLSSTLPYNNYN